LRYQGTSRFDKIALLAITLALVLSVKNCANESESEQIVFENQKLREYGATLEKENSRLRSLLRRKEEKCSDL
jgi:hypothetical protein